MRMRDWLMLAGNVLIAACDAGGAGQGDDDGGGGGDVGGTGGGGGSDVGGTGDAGGATASGGQSGSGGASTGMFGNWTDVGEVCSFHGQVGYWDGWAFCQDLVRKWFGLESQGTSTAPSFAAPEEIGVPTGPQSVGWLGGGWFFARPDGAEQLTVLSFDASEKQFVEHGASPSDPLEWQMFGSRSYSGVEVDTAANTTTITYGVGPYVTQCDWHRVTIDNAGEFGTPTTLGACPTADAHTSCHVTARLICGDYFYEVAGQCSLNGNNWVEDTVYVSSVLDASGTWKQTRSLPVAFVVANNFLWCANGYVYVGAGCDDLSTGHTANHLFAAKQEPDGTLSPWFDALAVGLPTCDDGVSNTPVEGVVVSVGSSYAWAFCGEKLMVAPQL